MSTVKISYKKGKNRKTIERKQAIKLTLFKEKIPDVDIRKHVLNKLKIILFSCKKEKSMYAIAYFMWKIPVVKKH